MKKAAMFTVLFAAIIVIGSAAHTAPQSNTAHDVGGDPMTVAPKNQI